MRLISTNGTRTKTKLNIRNITYSAVFLAVALVFKSFFSFYIPLFGEHGMKIGVSGVFTIMPSILFGPVYGAIVSALSDFLGYFLNPIGAYLPVMTLVMALGGFINGIVWLLLKNRNNKNLRIAVLSVVILSLLFGVWNLVALNADGITPLFYENAVPNEADISQMRFISRLLITRTISTSNPGDNLSTYINFTTFGPIGFTVFGLMLILADIALSKRLALTSRNFSVLQVLITMLVSGIVVSTLNTVILRNMLFESWKMLPFIAIWLPRVIETILTNVINAYFVALLYSAFIKNLRQGNDSL